MNRFFLSLLTSGFFVAPALSFAQQPPAQMKMRHMSITAAPGEETKPGTEAASPAAPLTEKKTTAKALTPQEALKKTDTLAEWPYYTDLMTIGNDTGVEKVIQIIDRDPGSVPPKGLLYAAKALSDRKDYERAAFYFYAGQLRATFDMTRFPPYIPDDRKPVIDRRTEDQRGRTPAAEIEVVNPHEAISVLALSIGQPIAKWAMADPDRLEKIMAEVREWDMATPYAYKPDYDISRPVPFETWPQLLTKTRNDYFTRVRQIAGGLRSVKPAAPSPTFTRP